MATANTLIDDAVRISGMPRPTIKGYVEQLRDANLIHKTGRGANAAAMTYLDATSLLAATLVAPIIAQAADATKAALNLPRNHAYVFDPYEQTSVTLHIDNSFNGDITHTKTFSDVLRRLLFRAVSFCAKNGTDCEEWELLFASADKSKIEVHFYRHADFAFVKLELTPTEHLCFEYGGADTSKRGESEKPSLIAYRKTGKQNINLGMVLSPTLVGYARSVLKSIPQSRRR